MMLVSVTGGISLVEGALCAAGPLVWGRRPVRTIGGCNKVEIAERSTYELCKPCDKQKGQAYHCCLLLLSRDFDSASTSPRRHRLV